MSRPESRGAGSATAAEVADDMTPIPDDPERGVSGVGSHETTMTNDELSYAGRGGSTHDVSNDETAGQLPAALSADTVRGIVLIARRVAEESGATGVDAILEKALDALDDEDPSVSDLTELADRVGADLSDLLDDDDGSDAAASSAAAINVSLTVNTREVAKAHGLPTDWHALDGIDLPPSLADTTLDDRGLAAAINRANGWVPAEGEGVTPHRVGRVRDKGGVDEFGASAEALADDDAGLNSDLDAEPPLPVSTVRQRVTRHLSKTGRAAGLNSRDGFGASLDDLDGE